MPYDTQNSFHIGWREQKYATIVITLGHLQLPMASDGHSSTQIPPRPALGLAVRLALDNENWQGPYTQRLILLGEMLVLEDHVEKSIYPTGDQVEREIPNSTQVF